MAVGIDLFGVTSPSRPLNISSPAPIAARLRRCLRCLSPVPHEAMAWMPDTEEATGKRLGMPQGLTDRMVAKVCSSCMTGLGCLLRLGGSRLRTHHTVAEWGQSASWEGEDAAGVVFRRDSDLFQRVPDHGEIVRAAQRIAPDKLQPEGGSGNRGACTGAHALIPLLASGTASWADAREGPEGGFQQSPRACRRFELLHQ